MKNTKSTIPPKLRKELQEDPEYEYCCITGERATYDDPIEWHHNLKFAGSNVQERFCILPLKRSLHLKADLADTREILDQAMIYRDKENKLFDPLGYSKAKNWRQRGIYLDEKLGPYTPPKPAPKTAQPVQEPKKSGGMELTKQEWAIVYKVRDQLREVHPDQKLSAREVLNHMILSFSE